MMILCSLQPNQPPLPDSIDLSPGHSSAESVSPISRHSTTMQVCSHRKPMSFRCLTLPIDLAIAKMVARFSEGVSVDFQVTVFIPRYLVSTKTLFKNVISRFTPDAATDFFFGASVESLNGSLPYPHNCTSHPPRVNAAGDFAAAFSEAQMVLATRNRQV